MEATSAQRVAGQADDRLRGGVRLVGLHVSGHPLCCRDAAAVSNGGHAASGCGRDALPAGPAAQQRAADQSQLVCGRSDGRIAAFRRKWRRLLGRADRAVGVAALLVASVSLWMVMIDWLRPGGVRPTGRVIAGLILGFSGLAFLVGPSRLAGKGRVDPIGATVLLLASLSWATGSVFSRRLHLPRAPLL